MKRRNFIKTAILSSIAAGVSLKTGLLSAQSGNAGAGAKSDCDLVAVMGGEPEAMYAKAIEAMGGIKKFVKPGQKVVIKPNIGWDKTPQMAANTNPQLVGAIVKDCLNAGAKEVVVFDHTCDSWQPCYKSSGIEEATKAAGGKIGYAHEEKYYRTVSLPKGKRMTECKIHEAILDADVWINVPILKNHDGARMSIAMKNLLGIVWNRRYLHSNDLQQCIADLATLDKKPTLNIVDAYRILTKNGPRGRSEADVQTPKALFMSADMVAVDTAAVAFFNQFVNMPLADVKHINMASDMKTGTSDLDKLKIQRIKL